MFTSMFDLEITYGEIKFDDHFKSKLLKWLDNNEEYLKQVNKQVNNIALSYLNHSYI